MAFNGNEGGTITLADGAAITAAYRGSKLNGGIKGQFLGKKILQDLLDQEGAMGIRIYYGADPDDTSVQKVVLVAADEEENDMLDLVADLALPCPSHCGVSNSLNS
ncbi:MAG: hypothetical protein P8M19_00560 [Crocinitomicaceae bacterium]|nr:hypothetical protein [Crocinitomicaceae bacterium]MDG1657044.1 hypothetical protein [Crocinitomicaceae bacterium]MDG2440133.1 hypothetical protein [Crocinitomicaceae bacterium]